MDEKYVYCPHAFPAASSCSWHRVKKLFWLWKKVGYSLFKYRADPEKTKEYFEKASWFLRSIDTAVLRRTVFFLESDELYSVEIWMKMTGIYCKSQQKDRTESDIPIVSLGRSESETDDRYLFIYVVFKYNHIPLFFSVLDW